MSPDDESITPDAEPGGEQRIADDGPAESLEKRLNGAVSGGLDLRPYLALADQISARRREEMDDDNISRLRAVAAAAEDDSATVDSAGNGPEPASSSDEPNAYMPRLSFDGLTTTESMVQATVHTGSGTPLEINIHLRAPEVDERLVQALASLSDHAAKRCQELTQDEVNKAFFTYNAHRKAMFQGF